MRYYDGCVSELKLCVQSEKLHVERHLAWRERQQVKCELTLCYPPLTLHERWLRALLLIQVCPERSEF